jgi:hypothetical protein
MALFGSGRIFGDAVAEKLSKDMPTLLLKYLPTLLLKCSNWDKTWLTEACTGSDVYLETLLVVPVVVVG